VLRTVVLTLFLGLVSACGGGNNLPTGPSPVIAEVEFRYVVSQSKDPSAASSTALPCAGPVSLHPSFWGFAQVGMVEIDENTWAILFEDVPIGRHSVRVEAPSGCDGSEIEANGVLLSAPGGTGADRAFGFTVHADGSVTP
jgi:hypothetical protein